MSAVEENPTKRKNEPAPERAPQSVRPAVGGAGGAVAGAARGAVAGPLGAAAGAVAGAVIGGESGYFTGLPAKPETERAYWEGAYPTRPYYSPEIPFETFEPGYRHGWESAASPDFRDQSFEDADPELRRRFESVELLGRPTW